MTQAKTNHLTEDDVRHIAKLARLHLTEDEVIKFQGQLSSAIDYIEILQKVDTSDVETPPQIIGKENTFRNDETSPSFSQDETLANAPKKKDGYFVTDAVFTE